MISFDVFYILNTAIECRVLPVFTNGMIVYATGVTPNFDLGTTATYSCNDGYTLDLSIGVEVRTCIDDGDNDAVGMFSDQEPACVRKYCSLYNISFIKTYNNNYDYLSYQIAEIGSIMSTQNS